jgi:hypothetical protein
MDHLFVLSQTTAGHSAEIGATFAVLIAVAVAIDWFVRWCHRIQVTPALVRLLHRAAMVLVFSDLLLISMDVGRTLLHRLPPIA